MNWSFIFAFQGVIALMGFVTLIEGRFLPSQMRMMRKPLPFVHHVGMWSEFLLLPFILERCLRFAHEWNQTLVWIIGVIALLAAYGLHRSWANGTEFEEHMLGPGRLHVNGSIHVVVFAFALTVLISFFFLSDTAGFAEMRIVGMLLCVHQVLSFSCVELVKKKGVIADCDVPSKVMAGLCTIIFVCLFVL